MIKRIHINQHVIKANFKNEANDPVITVKVGKQNLYGHEVEILGPSKLIYSPKKPLSCGAKVWLSCKCPVKILTEENDANNCPENPEQIPKRKWISLV